MRAKSKKYLIITLLFATSLIGSFFISQKVTADDKDDYFYNELEIIHAGYGDFDADNLQDDIIIFAKLNIDLDRAVKSYWLLIIELPSGEIFSFKFETTIMLQENNVILLKLIALNTAIEPGWYEATLIGYFRITDNGFLCLKDNIIFDPPGGGEGDPKIIFEVIYQTL